MTRFEQFAAPDVRLTQTRVPGTKKTFTFTRAVQNGALLRVEAAGRVYLDTAADGWVTLDGGLGRYREARGGKRLTRHTETPDQSWQEVYAFDAAGNLVHIDGVEIRRDGQGRVVACLGEEGIADHRWFYAYAAEGLVAIDRPGGVRHLSRLEDGRVTGFCEDGHWTRLRYNRAGAQLGVPQLPAATHHRDAAGRIWCVSDPDGTPRQTYLWDGWRCVGRIDGAPGDPLAAFFCLDPTATPVRMVARGGTIRMPRDAFGESLSTHFGTPGLFGAFQTRGRCFLPWRVLDPRLASFTSPDPFDGSESDPRRGPDGRYEGDLDVETDRQRPYDVCRNDPLNRADPSGGISAGLMLSSLTWSFQNNLLSFFGIDWWFNLFGSMFTGSNFFSSDQLTASKHVGAIGVRRDGVIPVITNQRAFTTQHIVWDAAESFDSLNDGMVIVPPGRFDPPLMGGPLLAEPDSADPFLLRGAPNDPSILWQRNGARAEASFPGASQPVFPSGGFHLAQVRENVRGPLACPLTELVPGAGLTTATADAEPARQVFETIERGIAEPNLVPLGPVGGIITADVAFFVLLEEGGNRLVTQILSVIRTGFSSGVDWRTRLRFRETVPDDIGPDNITLTRLASASTVETVQPAGGAAQGFSARGLAQTYPSADILVFRSEAGGNDVTHARATGPEAQLPLNAAAPAGMASPINVLETTLGPAVTVTINGMDTLDFGTTTAPGVGAIGLVSDGSTHFPLRIVDTASAPVLQTDADLTPLGASGDAITYRAVSAAGLLGRRSAPVEAGAVITYVPTNPGDAPDGADSPAVVLLSASGLPDTPRLVTGAPNYDAILTDVPITAGTAPWILEKRSHASAPNRITGFSTSELVGITPDNPDALTGARAIRVLSFAGTGKVPMPQGATLSGLAMNGQTASVTQLLASMPPRPRVTDVVALRQGGADRLTSVAGLRLRFDFDRPVDILNDAEDNYVVRLRRTGFEWAAAWVAVDQIRVTPFVDGVRSQFPRIRIGAALCVTWQVGAALDVQIYRVTSVEGLVVTLDGARNVPSAHDPDTLTAQLLEADDPQTGHQKIAIHLARDEAMPDTAAIADVWSPDAFLEVIDTSTMALLSGGALGFGLVSGGVTTPVVIQSGAQELTLSFAADTGLGGNADLHPLDELQRFEFPVTERPADPLLLDGSTTDLQAVLLQPFVPSETSLGTTTLNPGAVIVPNEEDVEVSRRQALVDHELAHTAQYHKFGPLWFCYFPLFLTELPVEFTTDLDQPDYGPSVRAILARVDARVQINPDSGLDVSDGDQIQILQGSDHETMTVASIENGTVFLRGSSRLQAGAVQVRKFNGGGIWPEVLLNIGRVTSHGGLLNTAVGFTWGGLLWLLSKGVYGAIRAIGGAGDQYPGTVAALGLAINLTDEEGRRELNANGQFIIKSGDRSVVRTATRSEDVLVLDQPIEFTGSVQVSAYASLDPGEAFDWLQYRAGTVDTENNASITLPGNGSRFSVGDRIEYIYHGRSGRTHVTAVTGDVVEIEDPISLSAGNFGEETSIRVAVLAEAATTLASADEAALLWMGMGWMRVLFDPYGQIEARVGATETWQTVLLRVMRVIMGSRNWSAMFPFLGYVFQARLMTFLPWCPPEHRATIEQDSSERSGDLYSPLSRLVGDVHEDGRYNDRAMAVGDIARFRYWRWTGARDLSEIGATADGGSLGAPGLHVNNRQRLRVIVNRTTGPDTFMPNEDTVTDPAGVYPPAQALPDQLFTKNLDAALGDLAGAGDIGFLPADLGAVPLSSEIVRNPSCYVAFCRPGEHRATIANSGFTSLQDGLDAFDDVTQAFDAQLHEKQNIWFNITVNDVEVRLNGRPVSEGDTLTLVQTQTAVLSVATTGTVPDVPRRYRVGVGAPETGNVLRLNGSMRLVAQGRTSGTTPEPVEVSRFFEFDPVSGTYLDPALAPYGLHLGNDLHIPVRGFDIVVTDVLSMKSAPDPAAAEVTNLVQGETAFVLVPTRAGEVFEYMRDGVASTDSDPELRFEIMDVPAEAASTVGPLGQVRRISFAEDPALSSHANIEILVPVSGEDDSVGTLRLTFTLAPSSG